MQMFVWFEPPQHGKYLKGWAGPITSWSRSTSPRVRYGKSTANYDSGYIYFDVEPFQLCVMGANSPRMNPSDKFTKFFVAGLGRDGELTPHFIDHKWDAMQVFREGWKTPDKAEVLFRIERAKELDREGMDNEIKMISRVISKGWAMNTSYPGELVRALSNWPQTNGLSDPWRGLLDLQKSKHSS